MHEVSPSSTNYGFSILAGFSLLHDCGQFSRKSRRLFFCRADRSAAPMPMLRRDIQAPDMRYPESKLARRRRCIYSAFNDEFNLQERNMSINTSTLGHARNKPAFSLFSLLSALFAIDLREELAARDRAGQADGSYFWGM
jgi:hypothetical protein